MATLPIPFNFQHYTLGFAQEVNAFHLQLHFHFQREGDASVVLFDFNTFTLSCSWPKALQAELAAESTMVLLDIV